MPQNVLNGCRLLCVQFRRARYQKRTNKGRVTWQTIVNQIKVVRSRGAANKVVALSQCLLKTQIREQSARLFRRSEVMMIAIDLARLDRSARTGRFAALSEHRARIVLSLTYLIPLCPILGAWFDFKGEKYDARMQGITGSRRHRVPVEGEEM